MNGLIIFSRNARAWTLCGLLLALGLAGGCGPKPAAPAAAPKPKADAAKAATNSVVETNSDEYISVFEDLPPPGGKDPFFPYSHRREAPKTVAVDANAPRPDPILILTTIVHTSKHSQAVINNEIFEAGEEQPVRVPNGKVKVRCIQIGKNFVLIQVEGEAEPKRLMMERKKN